MMVWIHDIRSGADVLINSEYVSSVERDQFDAAEFLVRMVNRDIYQVKDEAAAAWLTLRK